MDSCRRRSFIVGNGTLYFAANAAISPALSFDHRGLRQLQTHEFGLPAGLNQKILDATIGDTSVAAKVSVAARVRDWLNGRSYLSRHPACSLAMMLVFAVLVFTQTVSSDGSIAGIYFNKRELAEETYPKGA